MNWLAFIASIVRSVAWPAGVVVAAVIFRRPLHAALNQGIRRLRAGPVEVEFEAKLAEVRAEIRRTPEIADGGPPPRSMMLVDELAEVAVVSPRTAVLEAFDRVEKRLSEIVPAGGSSDATGPLETIHGPIELARLGRDLGLISAEALAAIEGMSVMRNLAAHNPSDISADKARDFLAVSDAVLYALQRRPFQ